jgi:hypothetical protein
LSVHSNISVPGRAWKPRQWGPASWCTWQLQCVQEMLPIEVTTSKLQTQRMVHPIVADLITAHKWVCECMQSCCLS